MTSPSQIAHYRVTAKIGQGGMGAVYRATDTKLNRDVAIKVLPPAFAEDAARMQRFEREAQVLASLNHPNIAAIYGIEQSAIVMELVEGEDLKGPLPVDTVIDYARQIAAGLEAAHERGIVHRDLKPANIKVTPDGVLKLLDFGLAKAREESASTASSASPTMSPTLSLAMTQAGMILGTAAYMAPEQARGKPVDRRADIWAFGVILHELLTGTMLFGGGETVSDSLAAVLTREPDYNSLSKDTPPRLRKLIERCLRKDPKQRLRDIGDARILLDEPEPEAPAAHAPSQSARLPWIVAAILAVGLLAALAMLWRTPKPAGGALMALDLDAGADVSDPALSPDGQRVVFVVNRQLAVRDLDARTIRYVPHSENARLPFFSPDGKAVAFFADRQLHRVSLEDSTRTTLCNAPNPTAGGVWGEDGVIRVAAFFGRTLVTVPAGGGTCNEASADGAGNGPAYLDSLVLLPGSKAMLTAVGGANPGIYALPSTGVAKLLIAGARSPRYLAASRHLLYYRNGVLYGVRFDPERLETAGATIALSEGVQLAGAGTPWIHFDVAGTSGTLVYNQERSVNRTVSWLEPDGSQAPILPQAGQYRTPTLSPNQKQLALANNSEGMGKIFLYDFGTRSLTRLIDQQSRNDLPVWSPDGETMVFRGDGTIQSLNFATRNRLEVAKRGEPWSFAPEGIFLVLSISAGMERHLHVAKVEKTPAGSRYGALQPLMSGLSGSHLAGVVSPDGKWLAFTYSETGGKYDIFVAPFRPGDPAQSVKWQISSGGGTWARWSTRNELFYSVNGQVMVAPYTVENGTFRPGKPRLWSTRKIADPGGLSGFDVTPDGKRVVALLDSEGSQPETHLRLMLNVVDELTRRESGGK